MYSFLISIVALIVGYFVYGAIVEKLFGSDPSRQTPAKYKADGVDFVPMPTWRVFLIQFLNIAGTGPVFGAIMGAKFGPSCYLWIVFGSIFAGGVHDYLCGMMSIRSGGLGVPNLVGHFLGPVVRRAMLIFSVFLLVLVGAVFVYSPALIIGDMADVLGSPKDSAILWGGVIFVYFIIATLLPIDKLIGRIYPIFAFAILFMALSLCWCLITKWPSLPEFWDGLGNRSASAGVQGQSIFPCLFITVACGAISGFHSTQSPLMARCITNEKYGRPVFYGSMITEGIVALIWAAVSSWFFFDGGFEATGAPSGQAPEVVTSVSKYWLGTFGSILAILGVVAAPITSGDTALRSARLIIADFFKIDQKPIWKRLAVAVPIFVVVALLVVYNIGDVDGFNKIWRYFGLANQALAAFVLMAATAYFVRSYNDMRFLVTMIPATFVTAVCVTYLFVDPTCFGVNPALTPWIAIGTVVLCGITFFIQRKRNGNKTVTL